MDQEPPDSSKRTSLILVEISKNPLLILLLGTALGSILVPQIDQRITRSRQLQELRTQKAISIIKSDNDTNAALNSIMTSFENRFQDDSTLITWNDNLSSFRSKVYSLHDDFNRVAWRWCPEAVKEAFLLRLMDSQGFRESQQTCDEYDASLRKATAARDYAWYLLFQGHQAAAAGTRAQVSHGCREFPAPRTLDEHEILRIELSCARAALKQSSREREARVGLLVRLLVGKDGSSH